MNRSRILRLMHGYSQNERAEKSDQHKNVVDGAGTWNRLLKLVIETSTEPGILGAGERCVLIGGKPRRSHRRSIRRAHKVLVESRRHRANI